jgi:hypothetical protein
MTSWHVAYRLMANLAAQSIQRGCTVAFIRRKSQSSHHRVVHAQRLQGTIAVT